MCGHWHVAIALSALYHVVSSQGALTKMLVPCCMDPSAIRIISQIKLLTYKFPSLRYFVIAVQNGHRYKGNCINLCVHVCFTITKYLR